MRRDKQLRLGFESSERNDGPLFAEFFAGIGLVRMGLEQVGWRVAFANDIDSVKFEIYAGHFGDAAEHFVIDDIRNIDPVTIPSVQLATASFPCTDLSLAGGRRGLCSGESSAFWAFADILDQLGQRRPPLILLENVTGFLTSHGGDDFLSAMMTLNEIGYAVDPFILDARWFVPQSRARLFVVGRLHAEAEVPRLMTPSRIRPKALIDVILRTRSDIHWAISTLPEPPSASAHRLADILEPLSHDDPMWWSASRAKYLFNQMSPRHQRIAEGMIRKRRYSYGTVFRRVRRQPDGVKRSMAELRTDGFAGCLRTPKGGSGRQILWKAGYDRYFVRLLTPRECARLMGADEFCITGSLNDALFGFGDAVCVPAIRWIADNYFAKLLEVSSSSSGDAAIAS